MYSSTGPGTQWVMGSPRANAPPHLRGANAYAGAMHHGDHARRARAYVVQVVRSKSW